jgi:hypothetical protein
MILCNIILLKIKRKNLIVKIQLIIHDYYKNLSKFIIQSIYIIYTLNDKL